MTLRQELRKNYTKYTQQQVADMLGVSRQFINLYEVGKKTSARLDIVYLGFRNSESDKIIIEYLKERENEKCN